MYDHSFALIQGWNLEASNACTRDYLPAESHKCMQKIAVETSVSYAISQKG
jgi:hypothetical protein